MKSKIKSGFSLVEIIICLAVIAIMAAMTIPASAQVYPETYVTVTNQPATVSATSSSNIVSWVPLYNDSGLGVSWKFNQSGSTTANGSLLIYSSVDGTNVSTSPFYTLTAASTGTADVVANKNWSPADLSGLKYLVIGSVTNAAATTLTNKAIVVRRPN